MTSMLAKLFGRQDATGCPPRDNRSSNEKRRREQEALLEAKARVQALEMRTRIIEGGAPHA